jgi:hypothetical protein
VALSDPGIVYVSAGKDWLGPTSRLAMEFINQATRGKPGRISPGSATVRAPELAIDPHDANRVFAAVLGHPYGADEERGIYLSDGGQNWQKVLSKVRTSAGPMWK